MNTLEDRLTRIEAMLAALLEVRQAAEWYSTARFAQLVGKAEFTVREWCRRGRIHAQKKNSGRGAHASWAISDEELRRFQREGLRPASRGELSPIEASSAS